jgi:carbon-monoxide dehydrogenase large subunit
MGELGFALPGYDAATVRMDPQGKVTLETGINSTGQSHQTTFAQVCAAGLGVKLEDVTVVQGDTSTTPYAAAGAIASRGAAVCGGATLLASRKLKAKLVEIGAHMLEAASDDIEIDDSRVFVKGSRDRALAMAEVATAALLAHDLPEGVDPGLEESHVYDPSDLTYPYATHIAVIEVDPGTGALTFHRYVVAHDCGTMINPVVVDGQIHGGSAQGIGGAILEELAYSDDGQPLATSFMDYLLPTSLDVPLIETAHFEIESPVTPGGMKGMGEGGAIGPPAAIANAVADALGVEVPETPLTPARVWSLIQEDGRKRDSQSGP